MQHTQHVFKHDAQHLILHSWLAEGEHHLQQRAISHPLLNEAAACGTHSLSYIALFAMAVQLISKIKHALASQFLAIVT